MDSSQSMLLPNGEQATAVTCLARHHDPARSAGGPGPVSSTVLAHGAGVVVGVVWGEEVVPGDVPPVVVVTDGVVSEVLVWVGVVVLAVEVVRGFGAAWVVRVMVAVVVVFVMVVVGAGLLVVVWVPPKKVVGWPLSVIECPVSRSGTV